MEKNRIDSSRKAFEFSDCDMEEGVPVSDEKRETQNQGDCERV